MNNKYHSPPSGAILGRVIVNIEAKPLLAACDQIANQRFDVSDVGEEIYQMVTVARKAITMSIVARKEQDQRNGLTMATRKELSGTAIHNAMVELTSQVNRRLQQHGHESYASVHEALGLLDEEYDEFRDAVRSKDADRRQQCASELLDIAVVCIIGLASINDGAIDF